MEKRGNVTALSLQQHGYSDYIQYSSQIVSVSGPYEIKESTMAMFSLIT